MSSYDTDSIKSEADYVFEPQAIDVETVQFYEHIYRHDEPILADFAMQAIEDAFDDQEYEMDLNKVMMDYKLST